MDYKRHSIVGMQAESIKLNNDEYQILKDVLLYIRKEQSEINIRIATGDRGTRTAIVELTNRKKVSLV